MLVVLDFLGMVMPKEPLVVVVVCGLAWRVWNTKSSRPGTRSSAFEARFGSEGGGSFFGG